MSSFKVFFLLVAICLIQTNCLKAHEWDFDNDWDVTWDPCLGEFRVTFTYYFDDSDDDRLEWLKVYYFNGNGDQILFAQLEDEDFEARDATFESNGRTFYTSNHGFPVSTSNEGRIGNKFKYSFVLKEVPDNLLGGNIKFKIRGKWLEGGGSDQDFSDQNIYKYESTQSISAVSNIRVSENECNRITISWDDPSEKPCSFGYKTFVDRRRSDSTIWYNIGYSSYDINQFIDNDVSDGVKYDYRTHTLFEPNEYQDDWAPNHTPTKTGFSKPAPPIPTSFTASTDRCDGKVLLEWTYPGTNHSSDTAIIERLHHSNFGNGDDPVVIRPGNNFTYIDNIGRGVYRYYRIREKNECNDVSSFVNANSLLPGVSPTLPLKCTLLVANITNNKVNLTWTDLANNETGYIVDRVSLKTSLLKSFFIPVPFNTPYSFTDSTINLCEEYEYKVYPTNPCVTSSADALKVNATVPPNLSTTFTANALDASKGYFPDKVELNWDYNNKNVIKRLKIYRKLLENHDSTYTLISTLNEGTGIFHDLFTEAGILYKYKIYAEAECGSVIETSNFSESVGFRNRTGTITGQVNYAGGIVVPNVRITSESSGGNAGSCLQFKGSYLSIQSSASLNPVREVMLETWIRPTAYSNNFNVIQKLSQFNLEYIHSSSTYRFTIIKGSSSQILSIQSSMIPLNSYSHLLVQANQDSLQIYVNGLRVASSVNHIGNIDFPLVSNGIAIGNNFTGELDELRIWNISKTEDQIFRDHSRIINSSESGLMVYLRMDEGVGNNAYDISQKNGSYLKNHATWIGSNLSWSTNIPSNANLSNTAYTDSLGNYQLQLPYKGSGQVFTLTPSYLTHQFNPSTVSLFIGDASLIHNSVNFIDKSSFRVQGSVIYENTSCGVEDIYIKLDGVPLIVGGGQAKTDPTGAFDIQIPIGEHYLELDKSGHKFAVGRFPSSGTYNFQEPLAGLLFTDSTRVKIIGRVAGGRREQLKPPGLGLSKNNIGIARIVFKSLQGNGCSIDTVYTDSLTGEYVCYLPPLRYVPTIKVLNNLGIVFSSVLQDFSTVPVLQKSYKIDTNSLGENINIDSVEYNYRLDYIYKVDPKIHVFDIDGVSPLIGDSTYTFVDPATNMDTTYNIKENPFRWPVFTQGDANKDYNILIRIFEEYANLDYSTPIKDTVPTTEGLLRIDNEMVSIPHAEVQLENALLNIDTLKSIVYTFKPGFPNFIENLSIPEYSFTKKIEINLDLPGGKIISWLPVPTDKVPPGGDKIYRAYLLGTQSNGEQFVTQGPEVVDYILRDPPGTSSSSSRTQGTTESKTVTWTWNLGGNVSTKDDIWVGTKFSSGIGVEIETEVENNLAAGFSVELGGGNKGSINQELTQTREWSTYSGKDIPTGASSDLFIGQSKNVQFGIAEELVIIPKNYCPQGNCFGGQDAQPDTSHSFSKKFGLSVIPTDYSTTFMVNQFDIENFIIPDLIKLRNLLLQTNSKYLSHLPTTDPNYGKNNDDPVFGNSVSTNTPDDGEYADLDGPSYKLTLVSASDTANFTDSVRMVNVQIKLWQNAIWLNEWEKSNIGNQDVIDSLKQLELDNLESEYASIIYEFNKFAGLYGIASIGNLLSLVVPVPGAAVAAAAGFAITTGEGIKLNELYKDYETYLRKKDSINTRFQDIGSSTNFTLTGGTNIKSLETHSIASNFTRNIEYNTSAELGFKAKGKIGGNGAGFEKSFKLAFRTSKNWARDVKSTETVSFNLSDPDIGDIYSVDVYPSLLGFGPIFKNKIGGRTSCPHEDEEKTKYYNPGTVIAERTLQIDKPNVSVSPSKLTNVPVLEQAVFNLNIANLSEVGYTNIYQVSVAQHTNPFGAIIGGTLGTLLTIPGGTSVNRVITIGKGAGPVHNYDSILILVHSTCQFKGGAGFIKDIVDSVYISAHFIPTCSNVSLITPEDRWVANTFNNNTLPLVLGNYNVNFNQFEKLRIDFKPTSSGTWIELKSLLKDTTGIPNATPISTITPTTQYNWNISDLPDGNYDLRVGSKCTQAGFNSLLYTGIIDRINPHAFGNPSPADGILSPNDEISIKFNEPIDLGSINPAVNFDVRGVTNGSPLRHYCSLLFDGSNDYLEIDGGLPLQTRDFTIEFSVKRNTLGEQVILSQGIDPNEQLLIGFDANNKIKFKINGQSVVSNTAITDNIWHHVAISYDFEGETAQIFLADQNTTAAIINTGNTAIFNDNTVNAPVMIGKNSATNNQFFSGNISELRVWNSNISINHFSVNLNNMIEANKPGILYNWRMDEANGTMASDHIRRRDAIIHGATWQISPNGFASSFDGINDHLKLTTGNVVITDNMDFTMEFWFNSSQSGAATLFSNGTGNGLESDSLYSWNIEKDANGIIHIKHKEIDFEATSQNYFDGKWHHFALVLQRNANLSSYIDGNLENSIQANQFSQLGGAHMYLGAHGTNIAQVESVTNFYSGKLDEFRFWNAARKTSQIQRDKQYRMLGDELGLQVYLPFESYAVDNTGIPILTQTFADQASMPHNVSNVNSTSLVNTTPTIKLQRPVQQIGFRYSVNNDQIIITPTSSPEIIENVTLDITVEGIKDLRGNVMESPVTWIAFMDKNQVVWQDDHLKYSIKRGDVLNFNSAIINSGGAPKKFEITDIPAWLNVTPSSGTVNPNSSIEVSFSVDPEVTLGSHQLDLGLLTDFNFAEKLRLEIIIKGTEPSWDFNPSNYENTMSIIGLIKVNNIISTDPDDKIIAMVGQSIRGVANLEYVPQIDAYRVFLNIYSNLTSGEALSFRVWDASAAKIYTDVTPTNLTFNVNNISGTLLNPIQFLTSNKVSYEIQTQTGWNWLTFFLETPAPKDFNSILQSVASTNSDLIKHSSNFSTYNGNSAWNGGLNGTNGIGILPQHMYKLFKSSPDTLILKGTIVDPSTKVITLNDGWTWLGFISIRPQSISQALGNLNPADGDIIKGKTSFASYNSGIGWVGSLKTMNPGQGFMYKSPAVKTFTYPIAGMFDNFKNEVSSRTDDDMYWETDHSNYNANLTMIASVDNPCQFNFENGQYGIGFKDVKGNWRGKNPIETIQGKEICFLTLAGNVEEELKAYFIDKANKLAYELQSNISFNANATFGSFDSPYKIKVSESICTEINTPLENDHFSVYPNLFEDWVNVEFYSKEIEENSMIKIYDIQGKTVLVKENKLTKGINSIKLDLLNYQLSEGMYILELHTQDKVFQQSIIKS